MYDTPAQIQAILRTELQLLEDYLLGNDVYRHIQIAELGNQFHIMSLGDFLEYRAVGHILETTCHASKADPETANGQRLLHIFQEQAQRLGARELKARLGILQWNMEDWSRQNTRNQQHYTTVMAQRTRMQRVGDMFGWSDLASTLADTDARIREVTVTGPFIGTPAYSAAYPEQAYWFLYRHIR